MVVYSILSQKEVINKALEELKFGQSKKIRCILLKIISSNNKLGYLHINKINNIKVKYKILKDADVAEKAILNDQ